MQNRPCARLQSARIRIRASAALALTGAALVSSCGPGEVGPKAASVPAPASGATAPAPAPPLSPEESALARTMNLDLPALEKEIKERGEVARSAPSVAVPPAPGGAGPASEPEGVLRTRVEARLLADPIVPAMSLAVEAQGRKVILTGRASNLAEVQRALLAALRTPGVEEVVSRVQVEPDDGSGSTKGEGSSPATR